jgi:hypothetical protein
VVVAVLVAAAVGTVVVDTGKQRPIA